MAKNDWARNAFRKAQNLMSRGYNDFEPATVVTKNELSNLKNTLLDDEATQPANGWTNLDNIFPSHLEEEQYSNGYDSWGGDKQGTRDQNPIHDSTRNPILDAAEDALGKAGVTHAFTEEDPIEDLSTELEDELEAAENELSSFEDFAFNTFSKWEETFNTPDSPALTATQATQGANLASKELAKLKKSLKKAKDESKEKIQDRIDQVTNIKDRLSQ